MRTFHSPGRFGDCIYQLYTVRALGGGDVYVSDYHTPSWSQQHIRDVLPLLQYQKYVREAKPIQFSGDEMSRWRTGGGKPVFIQRCVDHDLHDAEGDRNPKDFPEWDGRVWPGNIHIAKRYAVHFGVIWDKEAAWLDAPINDDAYDIVFHAPMRRLVRDPDGWKIILEVLAKDYRVLILGGTNDIEEWRHVRGVDCRVPRNFLKTAAHINSAKVFLGAASSCNVIAEALKKPRLVELAPDCFNTYPTECINDYDGSSIIEKVEAYCD